MWTTAHGPLISVHLQESGKAGRQIGSCPHSITGAREVRRCLVYIIDYLDKGQAMAELVLDQ